MKKLRIVLADDQRIFAETLKKYIEIASHELEVVDIASNGREVLEIIEKVLPDLVLMDVRMPTMDGVEAVSEIQKRFPNIKAIMLSTFDDYEYVQKAISYGAVGYLLKEDIEAEELLDVIKAAFRGAVVFSPNILPKLMTASQDGSETVGRDAFSKLPMWFYTLSKKEKKILYMILEGYENREISETMFLGEQTVKNYISIVYSKIGTHNRAQTIKLASPFKKYLSE